MLHLPLSVCAMLAVVLPMLDKPAVVRLASSDTTAHPDHTDPAFHAIPQAEACRALSRGLTALPSADVARRGLAPALLTLDGAARLGTDAAHGDGQGGRLWPTGCAMLAAVLAFPLVSPRQTLSQSVVFTCKDSMKRSRCNIKSLWTFCAFIAQHAPPAAKVLLSAAGLHHNSTC